MLVKTASDFMFQTMHKHVFFVACKMIRNYPKLRTSLTCLLFTFKPVIVILFFLSGHKCILLHKPNKKVYHMQPVDFLFPAPCRQIYTVSGNHDGRCIYIQGWRMVKISLVIRLTTSGFHVKHHCLISENMSLSVLHNSLYSYCCLQCL